jgi:hypothetical protein
VEEKDGERRISLLSPALSSLKSMGGERAF